MSKKRWSTVSNYTRRGVLKGAGCAACAAPLLALAPNAAHAAKMSQTAARYQSSPRGEQRCANCTPFVAPSSCTLVEGAVAANGWCMLWVRKRA
jgi:hypothetical protein